MFISLFFFYLIAFCEARDITDFPQTEWTTNLGNFRTSLIAEATPSLSLTPSLTTDYCSLHQDNRQDKCLPGARYSPLTDSCEGFPGNKCYQCYEGDSCKKRIPLNKCTLISGGGYPTIFIDYWQQQTIQGKPCISVPNDMVTNYQFGSSIFSGNIQKPSLLLIGGAGGSELDSGLRELHKSIHNVDPEVLDSYFLIPAAGSTQAMAAAMFGLSKKIVDEEETSTIPLKAFSQPPYYSHYQYQANTTVLPSGKQLLQWSAAEAVKLSDDELNSDPDNNPWIEVITFPNNPDGEYRKPRLRNKDRVIYDCVYLWPQYKFDLAIEHNETGKLPPIPFPKDADILLFSGSKLTGHAGSRFGWALVKDANVALNMEQYLIAQTLGVSTDTQVRFLGLVQHLSEGLREKKNEIANSVNDKATNPYTEFFTYSTNNFLYRWVILDGIFNTFKAHRSNYEWTNQKTKGAYMWMRCKKLDKNEDGETETCVQHISKHSGIIGLSGVPFGSTIDYVRFSLLGPDSEFDLFGKKMANMVLGPAGGSGEGYQDDNSFDFETLKRDAVVDKTFNVKSTEELEKTGWNPIWV